MPTRQIFYANYGPCGRDRIVVGFTTTYIYHQFLSPLKLWFFPEYSGFLHQ